MFIYIYMNHVYVYTFTPSLCTPTLCPSDLLTLPTEPPPLCLPISVSSSLDIMSPACFVEFIAISLHPHPLSPLPPSLCIPTLCNPLSPLLNHLSSHDRPPRSLRRSSALTHVRMCSTRIQIAASARMRVCKCERECCRKRDRPRMCCILRLV